MCSVLEKFDAAMAGQQAFYSDQALVQLMQDHTVQISRRSLMRVQAEFGERNGGFSSVLYLSSAPIDDASAQANFATNWGHIQDGAHGMTTLANVTRKELMNATGAPNRDHGFDINTASSWVHKLSSAGHHKLDLDVFLDEMPSAASPTAALHGSPLCFVDGKPASRSCGNP